VIGNRLLTLILDLRSPRGPTKGPQRPRPDNGGGGVGNGGGGGGGGAVFDTFNDNARFRSAPAHVIQPSQWASPQRETAPQPQPQPPQQQPMATAPPNRVLTPIQEGSQGSPPPRVARPFGAIPIPPEGAPPYRPFDNGSPYDMPHSPMYHPGAPAGEFSGERRLSQRNFDFHSEADLDLARPRVEEEKRDEPDAGGPVRRPDAL